MEPDGIDGRMLEEVDLVLLRSDQVDRDDILQSINHRFWYSCISKTRYLNHHIDPDCLSKNCKSTQYKYQHQSEPNH